MMEEFFKFLKKTYYIVKHSVTGCDEKDMDIYKDLKGTCRKCGRTYFFFKGGK